jgi:hypothetical protein
MSIGNVRIIDMLKLAAAVLALPAVVAIGLFLGCGGNHVLERDSRQSSPRDGNAEGDLDKYFLRDAATVEAMGLPVYWLGRDFAAGTLLFHGPYVAEFGGEVTGGGISMKYFAPLQNDAQLFEGPDTTLQVTTYSRAAWEVVEDRTTNPPTPGVTRKIVSVLGRNAEVFSAASATRPLNALWVVIDLDDVVVVARAQSGGPVSPGGPDHSPFINNPDLLIQVMEGLRPYPE